MVQTVTAASQRFGTPLPTLGDAATDSDYSNCYIQESGDGPAGGERIPDSTKATAAMPRRLRRTVALPVSPSWARPPPLAADLAAPLAPAARYTDWSGPYLGLEGSASGSYGAYSFGPSTVGGRGVPAFKSGDTTGRSDRGRDATTAVGGAYAGWNWQDGPWLYGIEAALDAANLKRPVPSTIAGFGYQGVDPAFDVIRAKTDVYGTLRARLGYSFDRYLVYATFGLAGANARVLATYPDLGTGAVGTAKTNLGYLGFTLGAGVQYAISDNLALGLDYRYVDLGESGRFSLGAVPGLGPVTSRASFTSNQMFLRLMWFPGGLTVPPDRDETAPHDPDNGDTGRFSLHGQTTLIAQGVPGFRSPYLGDQSLIPHQARQTTTATIFLGLKLAEGTELYYNPEFSQGFGLSRTLGVAGFVNGEAQKAGAPFPKLRSNRYYIKQTIGLGGETVEVPDGPNQVATRYDAERITLIAGKFALGDFFDGNVYAHDPRVDFFNWSLWGASAWDFRPTSPASRKASTPNTTGRNSRCGPPIPRCPSNPPATSSTPGCSSAPGSTSSSRSATCCRSSTSRARCASACSRTRATRPTTATSSPSPSSAPSATSTMPPRPPAGRAARAAATSTSNRR